MVISEKSQEKFLKKIEALRSRVKKLEHSEAERKRTEQTLQESEEKFRSFAENAPDYVVQLGRQGKILFTNRTYKNVSMERVLGSSIFEWLPAQYVSDMQSALSQVFKTAKQRIIEYRAEDSEGKLRWYSTHIGPIKKGDKVTSVILIIRDITDRKVSEKAIRESENTLKAILAASTVGIGLARDRTIQWCNESMSRLTGYSKKYMEGKSTRCLYESEQEYERVGRELYSGVIEKGIGEVETRLRRKDGKIIDCFLQASPLDPKDMSKGIIGVILDITERKKVVEEVENLAKFSSEDPNPVLRITKDGKILYCNDAGRILLAKWKSKVGGTIPTKWRKLISDVVVSEKGKTEEEEIKGKIFSVTIAPIKNAGYANLYAQEITDRKKAEEERKLTIGLLRLINSSNQMHELMKLVIVFLKDWSECEAVGIRLQEDEDYPYFITRGFPEEFILTENELCSKNEIGELVRDSQGRPFLECMCGNIISCRLDPSKPFFTKHGSFWTNSTTELLAGTTEADRMARTRNRCNTAGYESVALIPLRAGKETFGLLQFNDKQKGRFTPDKISLFERLADNLAIGLAQRRAEKALAESEENYRSIFDTANDAIFVHDTENGAILDVNQRTCELCKRSKEEILKLTVGGMSLGESPYSQKEAVQWVQRAVKEGPQLFEWLMKDKDGRLIWLEVNLKKVSICNEDRILAIVRDISGRKQAEEELRKQTQLSQVFLDSLPCVALLLRPKSREIVASNKRGIEAGAVPGKMCYSSWLKREDPCCWCLAPKLWENGQSQYVEVEDGGIVWDAHWVPIDEDLYLHYAFDITERKRAEVALRESESLLNEVGKISKIGGWRMDLTTRKARWTKGTYDIVEIEPGEPIPGPDEHVEYYLPEYRPMIEKAMQRLIENDEPLDFVAELKTAKGNIKWCQAIGRGIWKDGKCVEVYGTFQDITERKQAEQALGISEMQYRTTIDSMGDAIHVVDADLRIVLFNDRFKQWTEELDVKIDNPVGRKLLDVFPFLPDKISDEYKQVFKSGKVLTTEETIEIAGREIITETRKIAVYESGRVVRVVTVIRDITESKKAKEALQESEERFRGIYENALVGLYRTTPDGKILMANPAIVQMLGYSSFKELKKRNVEEVGFSMEYPRSAFKQRIEADGQVIGLESGWIKQDGTTLFVRESAKAIRDKEGRTLYYEGTVEDITERKLAEEALREREELLGATLESTADGILVVNNKGQVTHSNARMIQMWRIPKKLFETGDDTKLLPFAAEQLVYPEKFLTKVEALYGSNDEDFDTLFFKDGRVFERYSCPLIRDDENVGRVWSFRDITNQKRAEGALKESEEKFRSLAEQSPNMIFMNRKGKILYANKKCEEVTGYTREELYAPDFDFLTLVAPESRDLVKRNFDKHLEGEEILPYEYILIDKNGERIDAINTSKLVQYDGMPAIIGIVTDITERKKAERALCEREATLMSIFRAAPIGIGLVSNRVLLQVNDKVCEMSGYSRDELIGQNARILYPSDEDYEYVGREKYRQINECGTGTVETKWKCKDGRIIDIILSSTVFEHSDFSKGVTFTALDITGRKQAEQRLLEHRAQLKSLASELSLAEERERRRVAIELHDRIGQSLVISKMRLQTLCKSLSSSQYAEPLKEVYDCLGQVIQDTRTLTFDLSYPILYEFGFKEAVAEWLEEQIQRKHGIETEFEDDGQPERLDEDVRVLLFRDVRELLINVVKHAKASKVKVSISGIDNDIQVCVEDNGVGFNADEIALLPTRDGGFGLFSIRERLERIDGLLEIESAPDKGSRITMTAPIKCESIVDGAQK